MADIPEITLPTKPVLHLTEYFQIHDSALAMIFVAMAIVVISLVFKSRLKLIPSNFQLVIEGIVEFFFTQLKGSWGSEERARKYLSFVLTLFLFLLIANQFSVIPLAVSIVSDGLPVLRTPSSDLGLTITLALLVIVSSHVIAFASHPIGHIGNYIKFHEFLKVRSIGGFLNACLAVFLGVLDIIGEFAKVISLACRLFGNVFAGEVMVAVITGLVTYFVPMPFILISVFSGLIHAFVFAMLAVSFMPGIIRAAEPSPAQA